ncbi:MAG: hypothetical protein ACI89U_002811 [Gammaproteobacteria bacterium]|jgi:hypothetical protein
MGQFADIRPYNDSEVPSVVESLLADNEFIKAVARLKLGRWYKVVSLAALPLVRFVLRRQLTNVKTIRDFQAIVKRYMDAVVDRTVSEFTVSGVNALDASKPYLFMSNHRDIALDPAFINYALYHNNHDTVRIAIGDNLLTKSYVSDLMRINKSFIVKRSERGPRQILAAYKLLSRYIRHSIEDDNNPIWIAQREGRAKDGIDRTEPAIIKMIAMSQHKKIETFSEFINRLHIVPVSISYELDPCDGAKAKELYEKEVHGSYEKTEHEDVGSIAKGIAGNKGHVHVSFGQPICGEFEDAGQVATAIDEQIVGHYVLHPSNFIAYKMLNGHYPEGVYSARGVAFDIDGLEQVERDFRSRIDALPALHRKFALGIYANTIDSKNQFAGKC